MSCEDMHEHENYCKTCSTCHDCLDDGRERDAQLIKELEAHVERLRGALGNAVKGLLLLKDDPISKALNETPAQSLREIQAEAVEGALKWWGKENDYLAPNNHRSIEFRNISEEILDYAQQLRNGGG